MHRETGIGLREKIEIGREGGFDQPIRRKLGGREARERGRRAHEFSRSFPLEWRSPRCGDC